MAGLFGDDHVKTDGDGLAVDCGLSGDEAPSGVGNAGLAAFGHGQGIVDRNLDDDVAGFDVDNHKLWLVSGHNVKEGTGAGFKVCPGIGEGKAPCVGCETLDEVPQA